MKRYERGSEWRKWELHLHVPGTKLADGYGSPPDWDRFCQIIEESDAAAFGITDYFSVASIYEFTGQHHARFPQTEKVFFPNIEFRLTDVVNADSQNVNVHLLFRPDVTRARLEKLLSELKIQSTDASERNLRCSELQTEEQFMRATVTRADLRYAIQETFGSKVDRTDDVLILIPANNDGIRAAGGQLRRRELADEIDKLCDAIYGNRGNTDWFLRADRYDDTTQRSVPKPVFAGCDAHSFEQLEQSLGRAIREESNRKEITWIKADPTYEGLLQTLIEPGSRVSLSDAIPNYKEPYKYIAAAHFAHADEFPSSIQLNQSLVSIIGSRSSGKSALLAYIAHAVNPEYTLDQQVATGSTSARNAGPAAGKTWAEVDYVGCTVEWGDAKASTGKVIYIPQNSLFAVSERPEHITAKIQPALYRMDPEFAAAHTRTQADVQTTSLALSTSVATWFDLQDKLTQGRADFRDLGDASAVTATRDSLGARIAELRAASSLSDDDVTQYQALVDQLGQSQNRLDSIRTELVALAFYVEPRDAADTPTVAGVHVEIRLVPDPVTFPAALEARLEKLLREARQPLFERVAEEIAAYYRGLREEEATLTTASDRLRQENAALIERNQANAEIEALVQSQAKQIETLSKIEAKRSELAALAESQKAAVQAIRDGIAARQDHVQQLINTFEDKERKLDDMAFGIEAQVTEDAILAASSGFNRQENTDYFDRSSELVNLQNVFDDPDKFLTAVYTGDQKLKRGMLPASVASEVLTVASEVRFSATLEGDRIGGFQRSSMTPGKQALFALTLILNESTEAWPLLIDQPEDDLDSRSIWDTIVPYLMARKRDRQILMATHDANLVIGADSEQIVVANRHGVDRKNRNDRMFSYMSGSLEHSMAKTPTEYVLESCGIREHACDILDGGEDAFRKRKEKYKI
jgi:ABC-type cobalamin/Fe3+-siderophores transport system ATPase subunit